MWLQFETQIFIYFIDFFLEFKKKKNIYLYTLKIIKSSKLIEWYNTNLISQTQK